jgi:hypothetical protein
MRTIFNSARRTLRRLGIDVRRCNLNDRGEVVDPQVWSELTSADRAIIDRAAGFTMTSSENLAALVDAIRYLIRAQVPGAFVECGVWRGGSMMAAALTLLDQNDRSRDLYLFDTFQGVPPPSDKDKDPSGRPAAEVMRERPDPNAPGGTWCYASLDDVRSNMTSTGYPADRIRYVEGKVEDTIPSAAPEQIALLRLDTDWYESTRHELIHLFPRLSNGGVLVLDDYGDWQGARQATDEYFAAHPETPVLLTRVHRGVRLAVKCFK